MCCDSAASIDLVGAGAPKQEIEITPEMIEASAEILLGELGGGVSCHWDAYDLAALVYRAMVGLDRKRNRVLSRNLAR